MKIRRGGNRIHFIIIVGNAKFPTRYQSDGMQIAIMADVIKYCRSLSHHLQGQRTLMCDSRTRVCDKSLHTALTHYYLQVLTRAAENGLI
jgi:hypothetical protein